MTSDPHLWPPEAAEAIRTELVRVTLTGDDRPELEQPPARTAALAAYVAGTCSCKVAATVHPAPCPRHLPAWPDGPRRGFPLSG